MDKDQVELFVKIMQNIQEQFDLQDKKINFLIEKQNEINNQFNENIMILRDSFIKFTRPL